MKKIEIDEKLIKQCKKERALLRKYLSKYSFFWNPDLKIPKKFSKIVEELFPTDFHGEAILNYEAWSFRSYLETMLYMGHCLGKNPKKVKENQKKIKKQMRRLEKFKIKIGKYLYFIDQISHLEEDGDNVLFYAEFAMNKIEIDKSLFYKELQKTTNKIKSLTKK